MNHQPKNTINHDPDPLDRCVSTPFSRGAALAAALAVMAAGGARAGIFSNPSNMLPDPTITGSQTAYDGNYVASNVFDNVIAGVEANNVYATGGSAGDAYINFDFGTAATVGGFVFYQRFSPADNVTAFDLIFSNNSDFTAPITTLRFATSGTRDFTLAVQAAVGDPTRQEFEFASAVNARYVKWAVVTSGNIYDGATEMEFWTNPVPEPHAALLGGLGLLMLLRRRRA